VQVCRMAHELRCAAMGPHRCVLSTTSLDDQYYGVEWGLSDLFRNSTTVSSG